MRLLIGVLVVVAATLVGAQNKTDTTTGQPIPQVPAVFGAEVEMSVYNGTDRSNPGARSFAFYEQIDFVRNMSKVTFRIESQRMVSTVDEVVVADWSAQKSYTLWEGKCAHYKQPNGTQEERFTLSELIFLARHPSVQHVGSDSIRGIEADVWAAKGLPLSKAGGLVTGTLDMKWYFSASRWGTWGQTGQQLLEVSIDGSIQGGWKSLQDVHLSLSVVDISPSRAWSDDTFTIPEACAQEDVGDPTASPNMTTAAPPLDEINPMPDLPDQWSAVIETNMRELKQTFTTYEWFNSAKAQAHSAWIRPMLDSYDRQLRQDIYIFGDFQIAYQATTNAVPKGYKSDFNPNERVMFFPDKYTCSKNVFNKDLVGSTDDVLLKSAAPRARYMGSTTVRGIKAQYWQSGTGNYKVQWYFTDKDWPYSSSNGTVLLRMSIVGSGRAPLFVHHPFLQSYQAVPESMIEACELFMGGLLDYCSANTAYYHHVHDFFSFSDVLVSSDFALPSTCVDEGSSINSVPAAKNCREGMTDAGMIFVVILVVIFTMMITSLFWSVRMRSKLDAIKEDSTKAQQGQRPRSGDQEFSRME